MGYLLSGSSMAKKWWWFAVVLLAGPILCEATENIFAAEDNNNLMLSRGIKRHIDWFLSLLGQISWRARSGVLASVKISRLSIAALWSNADDG
ncbi:hypothetical protein ABT56_20420 [Photobacterium aquae]|uniref:Uncharacterized protein n=1 Tax=Photobacterium aquae TaxID=1195763 RepID=A0A0J1GU36_9GAMM|nr:hypothetical protein ABT56_20420 [Photobacterium aquae]